MAGDFFRACLWTGAILALVGLAPITTGFLLLVLPQPGLMLAARRGLPPLLLATAVIAAATAALAGPILAGVYIAGFGLLTLALGLLLRRPLAIEATVAGATLPVAAAAVLSLFSLTTPAEIADRARTVLEVGRLAMMDTVREGGASLEMVAQLEEAVPRLIDLAVSLAPALGLVAIATIVLANLLLLRARERRRGAPPSFGDLTRWKCPPAAIWLLIACGYGLVLPDPTVRTIAGNGLVIALAVYFWQGMAIVRFYFLRWHVAGWARVIAYSLLAVEWLIAGAVVLIGIFDMWGDFRRLTPRPVEEE